MGRTYSDKIKQKARSLRLDGWTLGEIGLKLQVPNNTISGWVKNIKLNAKQERRIKQKIAVLLKSAGLWLLPQTGAKWSSGKKRSVIL